MPSHGTGPVIARTEIRGMAAGLEQFKKYAFVTAPSQARRMLEAKAKMVFDQSQIFVPRGPTEQLHDTAEMVTEEVAAGRFVVSIVYPMPYAIYVHEVIYAPSGRAVYHAPPTQAKFLERAVGAKWSELNDPTWANTFFVSGFEAFDAGHDPRG